MVKIFYYEITTLLRQAHALVTPLLFFILVVMLFSISLGPDVNLLKYLTPIIIWIAALLAILLSINQLFRNDLEEGYLDLVILSPCPLTLFVICKLICHWLTHCLPLIFISAFFGFLLNLPAAEMTALIVSLLLGTPVLVMLGGIGAALVIGIRNAGLLLPILIMPLYIPVLIFGIGTMMASARLAPLQGYFAMMGALMLLSLAFAPILTSVALRIGVSQ